MKIEEMSPDQTYIECPDYQCKLWYVEETSCERDCPQRDKLVQIVKCWNCDELIKLDIDYSSARRLSHICENGANPFILKSGTISVLRTKIEN